ncbi:MAG: hypothetical protein ACRDV9_04825, partial [Acidimicrobiia bacterium]
MWTPTISGSSGSIDILADTGPTGGRYMHLDNNPMDGIAGQASPREFEVYAQLVGGLDNGADTRGAPPTGVGASSSDHARGLFSNNDLRFYDNLNFASGSAWSSSKWATTSTSGDRKVDIQGGRGRIQTGASTSSSSTARATAQIADLLDAEVNFTHEFCTVGSSPCTSDRNSGTDLRVHLRGKGASSTTSGVDTAYRLDIDSGSTTVKVKKLIDGTASTLGSFTYDPDGNGAPDPGRHGVKFRVEGSTIQAAMFPGSAWDGAWDTTVSNAEVSDPGNLQITHYRASSG